MALEGFVFQSVILQGTVVHVQCQQVMRRVIKEG